MLWHKNCPMNNKDDDTGNLISILVNKRYTICYGCGVKVPITNRHIVLRKRFPLYEGSFLTWL